MTDVYVVVGFTGKNETYEEWQVLVFKDPLLAELFLDELMNIYLEFPNKRPRSRYEKSVLYESMKEFDPLFREKENGVGYYMSRVKMVEKELEDDL